MDDGLLIIILAGFALAMYVMWNINTVNEARHRENIRDEIIRGLINSEVAERQAAGCGGCLLPLIAILVIVLLAMLLGSGPQY